jgi:hypothetical protein
VAPEEDRPVVLITDFEVPEAWDEWTGEKAVVEAIVGLTAQAMARAGIDAALASWGILHRRHGLSLLRPRWHEP